MKSLAIHGGSPVCSPNAGRFRWPVITADIEAAVLEQLRNSISIYDGDGVFGLFEKEFAAIHGRKAAVLFSSGTAAIHAMYEAAQLGPGDELLCPAYTFHATVSPLMMTGAVPVFCDSDHLGNIRLDEIVRRTTQRTQAVIVTHMWGRVADDVAEIAEYCKAAGLLLLEDCSHAHGAKLNGQIAGSFGDMAAWSLQGQKTVSGGEGGIFATDDEELYHRAVLFGHYNKRPKKEIPKENPLSSYSLTGSGLKLRAHPLAIAIALNQLRKLDGFIYQRSKFAAIMEQALYDFPFFKSHRSENGNPNWYAFTFGFDQLQANGVPREVLVRALHLEGLLEFDIPGSTGLLHAEPLFTNPACLHKSRYSSNLESQDGFPVALRFVSNVIKLPVWAYQTDEPIVLLYVEGLRKVSEHLLTNGGI